MDGMEKADEYLQAALYMLLFMKYSVKELVKDSLKEEHDWIFPEIRQFLVKPYQLSLSMDDHNYYHHNDNNSFRDHQYLFTTKDYC